MKTILLDNVISNKELFFMYNVVMSSPGWRLNGTSSTEEGHNYAPNLMVKDRDGPAEQFAYYYWGQSVIYRIYELLKTKNIGIPTILDRMWFNCTYSGKKTQHWLHNDIEGPKENIVSMLIFMTPIWQPDWKGSFYVDGEEFKFRPGSAVIFDSSEYHQGEAPESETHNWQRITCNILAKQI